MHHFQGASAAVVRIALLCFTFSVGADNTLPRVIDSLASDTAQKEANSPPVLVVQSKVPDSSPIRQQSSTAAIVGQFGEFHRLKGIYGLIAGTLGIFAGVVLLDKADSVPLAIASMSLGGVSIGLGLWEIKLGSSLLKKQSQFP
jgi:hypothetical protein